jgi:hypothetical protein
VGPVSGPDLQQCTASLTPAASVAADDIVNCAITTVTMAAAFFVHTLWGMVDTDV